MAARPEPRAKKLDATDYRILEACLRNPEARQQDIADALEISLRTVSRRLQNPELQAELRASYERSVEHAIKIARANAPKTVRRLLKIISPPAGAIMPEDRDVINACRELLRIVESKELTVKFDKDGLTVNHKIDPAKCSDEELAFLEAMVARQAGVTLDRDHEEQTN